ncbi:DNA polymerase III, alpha subunit (plasmid) [Gemmatirosa kalamazoonensis]|uniref:DNA-directed DNA polymerase n=1 Tax=Gemmatirosa kalamazoonensis TaxID=861299 RepID=W0RSH6_9BACT|nr:DNA polymerase III, alpha subunit [Gemmatirosa kalamazoonensis]
MDYVELRAHTAFSFGDGACTPEALAARAATLGYRSLGITDHADLGAVIRFALACRTLELKPVVGIELAVDGAPLALIARTEAGFHALGAHVTAARAGHVGEWQRDDAGRTAGTPPRGRPNVSWRRVAARAEGVVLLTGPASGRLARRLLRGQRAEAERLLAEYREAFGEHVAVEVQLHHAGRREEALAGALIDLAERSGVPWVVTGDSRWVDDAGRRAHDVLTALRHGVTIDEAASRGLLLPNDTWGLEAPAVVAARWRAREAGIATSAAIAAACTFSLAWVRPPLPDFPVPNGSASARSVDDYLRERTYIGARERWGEDLSERHVAQLEHELGVIGRLGFAGFFLTMWDAVREARSRRIMCQGRGSAANSAVTFCLGITAVDPIRHGLLFERFLSEARVDGLTEAPDIDLDVEHDRREELLDYMYAKYGRAHAAITGVTQQYSAPTAIQDVGRAYGIPAQTVFAMSKRVHNLEPAAGAARLREGLAAEHGVDVTTARGTAMLAAIAAFEGLPRMRSTHPGGFVLSSAPLGEYCPIEPTTMGRTIIQFDKDDLDAAGIPKYDFLGLGSLAAVRRAFDVLEERSGTRPTLYGLPQDDAKAYDLIARGDTVGLFQIESRAQIASLVNTRPDRLYDIVVQVALIRPGPIQAKFVHPYTERRRGREAVTYLHPDLEPILKRTMGIPIFQEQAMALSMALAGYSAAEADELRRTMGHQRKLQRLLDALQRLTARMIERGIAPDVAVQIAEDLTSFANYGFPESHAWSFALIAYATAWLKAHHAAAFYIGLLNAQPMGFYSIATLVHDARHHGVEVRLPDVVLGGPLCTAESSEASADGVAMRVGWKFVRGIGDQALERLTAARAEAPFASVADVVRRARLSRAEAQALARAQAFASFERDRRRAGWDALGAAGDTLPLAPVASTVYTSPAPPDAAPPDAAPPDAAPPADGFAPPAIGRIESVFADYHALGLSTAGHPTERFRAWARRVGAIDTSELPHAKQGSRVILVGLVTVRQRPHSANGTMFLLMEDEHGSANVIVWPKLYEQHRETIAFSPFLAIYGTVERDGGQVSIIGRRFQALGTAEAVEEARHEEPGGGAETRAGPAAAELAVMARQARSFR